MAVISWGDEVKKPKGGTVAFTDGKLAYQPPAETETPRWINPLGWNPQSMADYRGVMSPINLDWPGPELNWKPQGMADFMGARTYFQPGAASRQAAQAGTMAQAMGAKSYIQLDRPQIVNNPSKMTQSQPQAPTVEQPANPLEQHGRGQSGQSRTMANGDVYNYWAKYGQEMTRQGLIRQGVMDGTNYNSNNPLFDLRSSNMEFGRYGVGDLRYKVPTTNTATAGTGGGYGRGYGYGYGGGGGSYNYSRPKPKWFMEMLSWRI